MDVYNDFQRMVRSDNIADVIDRHHIRIGKDCTDYDTKSAMNEVLDVIDEMKKCKRRTYPALIKLCKFCASFSVVQMALFLHVIQNRPLIEFAIGEGITEQAVHQMWNRMIARNPELEVLRKKRRYRDGYSSHGVLERRKGEGRGMC